jgi:TonB-dependent receptor
LAEIFAPEHFGPGLFRFIPVTAFAGEYTGKHRLNAWYGMLEMPMTVAGQRLRISGGARLENSDQLVETVAAADDLTPITTKIYKKDVLPSTNLTWSPLAAVNLRAAWFRSVNRPEFREMANVLWYDFERMQNVIGNPDLERATIENRDLRLEVFPAAGEVLAVSWFSKEIENAIEEALLPAPTRYVRTWFNSPRGRNRGYELEVRKNLGFLWGPLDGFTVNGNYTRVVSEIAYEFRSVRPDGSHLIENRTRLMQGQAPWTLNVGVGWERPEWGTTFNVLLNKVARRLEAVGETRDEDVFEEPRDLVDLALTQRLAGSLQAKVSIRNLNGKDEVLTIGPDGLPFSRLERGRSYSLSLSLEM